ncbi:type II toxin-antitoxin system HicA family toxin [Dyadobacter sp. CY351]|jgi:mRNA interferase HicA|uniref:type II toxin-antitoxin system HicA family toxin n=1 Tax=Dyadobacter sp. CY351 TaxID=2909337 RepID=UPI0038D36578
MKYSEFHRIIRRNGWLHIRTRGSHCIYQKNGQTYSVANHGAREMPEGTRLKAIKGMNLELR